MEYVMALVVGAAGGFICAVITAKRTIGKYESVSEQQRWRREHSTQSVAHWSPEVVEHLRSRK